MSGQAHAHVIATGLLIQAQSKLRQHRQQVIEDIPLDALVLGPHRGGGEAVDFQRNRSMNPTHRKVEAKVTVASLANSSMAAALRSLLLTTHAAVAQVRGAATYRALGR